MRRKITSFEVQLCATLHCMQRLPKVYHEQGDVCREHADVGDLVARLGDVILEDRVPPAEMQDYCVDNSVSQKYPQLFTNTKRQASSFCGAFIVATVANFVAHWGLSAREYSTSQSYLSRPWKYALSHALGSNVQRPLKPLVKLFSPRPKVFELWLPHVPAQGSSGASIGSAPGPVEQAPCDFPAKEGGGRGGMCASRPAPKFD